MASQRALYHNAHNTAMRFSRRFQVLARNGQYLQTIVPVERGGVKLLFIGGPRNPRAEIPASTRMGLVAAFRSAVRAAKAAQS